MPSHYSKPEGPELEGTSDGTSPSGTEVPTRVRHPQEATALELVRLQRLATYFRSPKLARRPIIAISMIIGYLEQKTRRVINDDHAEMR
jgi:hypothetical protein